MSKTIDGLVIGAVMCGSVTITPAEEIRYEFSFDHPMSWAWSRS